jgi:hypothetical protein
LVDLEIEENDRVFGNSRNECNAVQLIEKVRAEFRLWEFARLGERRVVPREYLVGVCEGCAGATASSSPGVL